MDLPSTRNLQALAALRGAHSLSKAAETLGVTRSALSHRIAELERQLGVTLVRQAGRCATLTDDAESLLMVMGDALDRIDAAVMPLRRRREQLRISTVATFASHWLIPRITNWQRKHPHIELAISTSTRTVDFLAKDYDCATRHGVGGWEGVSETLLFRETLIPVARADHLDLATDSTIIRARSRFRDWQRWWQGIGMAAKPPERSVVVETRAQAMDAAYASPHLAEGRLRALGSTLQL